MLFIFGNGRASDFWMFGMRFPLDLIWISSDCTVADITPQVPAPEPDTPASQLEFYNPASPASHTFEINAGEAEKHGITVGAPVRFVGFSAESGAACE